MFLIEQLKKCNPVLYAMESFNYYTPLKGGGSQVKARVMCTRGGRLTHLSMYAKSILHIFCNNFICKVFLSYLAVFGDNFNFYFIKHLL